MEESKERAALQARLVGAEKRHAAASKLILEMKGQPGFHQRLYELSAAADEVDELKKELEPYELEDADMRFAAYCTVPNILTQVKQLRDELDSVDEARVKTACQHAADFAINNLWKMMRRHGGNPPPPQPRPVHEPPEIHAALDAVEKWCENAGCKSDCPVTLKDDGRTVVIGDKDYPIAPAEFATLRVLVELHPRRPGKEELVNICDRRGVSQPVKAFTRTYNRGEPFSRILHKPGSSKDGYGFKVATSAT